MTDAPAPRCKAPLCDRPANVGRAGTPNMRGLCSMHYQRIKREEERRAKGLPPLYDLETLERIDPAAEEAKRAAEREERERQRQEAEAAKAQAREAPRKAFEAFLARYRSDPVLFVRELLKIDPDPWQAELLMAVARGERRISVRSGHGVGKSSVASWAMIWFLLTRWPVKVVVTAPTSGQLYDALFAELRRWIKELPAALADLLEATSDRVTLKASPTEAFISARTSSKEKPEALQGVHSEHVLLVVDEASGVPEEVYEAAAGSMSGENACTILLGNPTRTSGFFFRTHHALRDKWWTRRVSSAESKRVSKDFVEDMAHRYGEGSNAYRVRVLGDFPTADDDVLIPRELVEAAMRRDIAISPGAPEVWGLDVARFGSDRTVLVRRRAGVVLELKVWRQLDLMQTCGIVVNLYEEAKRKPEEILVDSIGIGAGVVDRLLELRLPVRGVNVSEATAMNPQAARLRDDLWLQVKAWLERRDCKLPADDDLAADLSGPTFTFTSSGRIKVEGKDEMKRRGLASPDLADALALTFASTAALVAGAGALRSWAQPLRRNLPVV